MHVPGVRSMFENNAKISEHGLHACSGFSVDHVHNVLRQGLDLFRFDNNTFKVDRTSGRLGSVLTAVEALVGAFGHLRHGRQ